MIDLQNQPARNGYAAGPSVSRFSAGKLGELQLGIVLFLILLTASVCIFWNALATQIRSSLWDGSFSESNSYTLAIPSVSAMLVYLERKRIFAGARFCSCAGALLFLGVMAVDGAMISSLPGHWPENALPTNILCVVTLWIGAFALSFGLRPLRAGAFPALFLLLTVPLPGTWLEKPLKVVQYGSTAVCALAFSLLRVPYSREGFVFYLKHISILVAKQCSGIHSTIAIFIISLIAADIMLSFSSRTVVLVLTTLPIVCVTNGLRIAMLTLLAEYINPRYMDGPLHHEGGIGFFLLALVIMFGILHLLKKSEMTTVPPQSTPEKR